MSILDEAKEKAESLLGDGKADAVIDKVEGFINDKTGDKFADKVDKVTDAVRERLGGEAD